MLPKKEKEINPNIIINKHQKFYTPETSAEFDFTQYDYIVDAIDTVTGKIETCYAGKKSEHPYNLFNGCGK